jgi:hypothetical protein
MLILLVFKKYKKIRKVNRRSTAAPTRSHHRPLPPTGVKTSQQHTHRAISAVHTVSQQCRHRSTVALCTLQHRLICHPKQRRRRQTHNKPTRSEEDPKKEKAEKRGRSKKKKPKQI